MADHANSMALCAKFCAQPEAAVPDCGIASFERSHSTGKGHPRLPELFLINH